VIFVDTSFWVALAVAADGRHRDAAALLAASASRPLATSNLACGETWTFIRRRFDHRRAVEVIDTPEGTRRLRVLRVETEVERAAWDWLRRRPEREGSFVDATSFALMRHLRIDEAFAFDGGFAAAGFIELRT
jgi:predicted nucleic acid-binding protein